MLACFASLFLKKENFFSLVNLFSSGDYSYRKNLLSLESKLESKFLPKDTVAFYEERKCT